METRPEIVALAKAIREYGEHAPALTLTEKIVASEALAERLFALARQALDREQV